MKKGLCKKIILISLLCLVFFSSLNFSLETPKSIFCIEKANAQPLPPGYVPGYNSGSNVGSPPGSVSTEEQFEAVSQPKGFFAGLADMAEGAITGPIGKIVMMVNGLLLQAIAIPLMSILFRTAAAFLDMSVNFTLSTDIFGDTSQGIITVWKLIRDICNITFIFILLWAAIQMIIGIAGSNAKKMIANVVIAALLINFSLFITRIIIDAGNILAVSLYDQIQAGSSVVGGETVKFAGQGLGAILMQALGMSGITGAVKEAAEGGVYSISFGVISSLQLITILVAFIVFMYAMLLMASRIVLLIFLMTMSPIGFMGSVLPKLAEYSKMWRETLYGQVMIAPIFLLFVYLILQVANAFNEVPKGTIVSAEGLDELKDTAQYLAYFKYVMVILLLIVAVKITKKMTGVVGQMVEKFGGMAVGAALGLATGGAALAMRQTLGRASANALEGDKGADLRARAAAGDKKARIELAYHEKASKSSFDVRNTKAAGVAGKAFGDIGGQLGIKIPSTGKPSGLASVVGMGGTVAEARKAQQEAENKKYNELAAAVTNKQKLAANAARVKRDGFVDDELEGTIDPATGLRIPTTVTSVDGLAYQAAKKAKKDILKVEDTHRDLQFEQAGLVGAQNELARAQATNDQAQINKAQKELNEAQRIKDKKIKDIQEEIKKKRAGEIAQLDEDMKTIKTKAEKQHENSLTPQEQAQMAIINQARNYAESVRQGRLGSLSYIQGQARRTDLADRMENQRQS